MLKTLLTCCLVLLFWCAGYAQKQHGSAKQRAVGVSLGWQNFKFNDQHASPLSYGTNSIFPSLGLFYKRHTAQSHLDVRLSGAIGQANPLRYGARSYKAKWSPTDSFRYQISSQFIHANIAATYLRQISSMATDHLQYWVGGTIKESVYYADEVANLPWMFNSLDLSPTAQVNYIPSSKHNLGIRIDFAAIGLITSQVYALFPKSNKDRNVPAYLKQGSRIATVNKLRNAGLQLSYQYQVAKHFAFGASYQVRWMSYSKYKTIHAVDRHFDINLAYTY